MNNKHQQQKVDVWNEKSFKRQLIKYYKEGHCLGEICRKYHLDISTTLHILKTGKIRKTKLYEIHEEQDIRAERKTFDLILESEKYHLDKFFPNIELGDFTTSYYYYWKNKHDKTEQKKEICKHRIRNIRCATCGKILGDATHIDIHISEPKIIKI